MVHIDEARAKDPMLTGQDGSEAMYSPNTAVVDPIACLHSLYKQVQDMNPNFKAHFGCELHEIADGKREITTKEGQVFEYKHLVNAAGQ